MSVTYKHSISFIPDFANVKYLTAEIMFDMATLSFTSQKKETGIISQIKNLLNKQYFDASLKLKTPNNTPNPRTDRKSQSNSPYFL